MPLLLLTGAVYVPFHDAGLGAAGAGKLGTTSARLCSSTIARANAKCRIEMARVCSPTLKNGALADLGC